MRGGGQTGLSYSSVATEREKHPAFSNVGSRWPGTGIADLMRLSLLDRYLVSEVLWRLGAAIAIITCGLMLQRMLVMVDSLVNQGIPLRPVVTMLLNLLPYYLRQALPAAFLVAVLLGVAQLRNEGAVEAMLSSGIGTHRLLRPLTALSAVLWIISVIIAGWLQPYGLYAYHWTLDDLTHQVWLANLAPGQLFTGFEGKMITFQSADETTLTGVFIHESDSPGNTTEQERVTITAKTGKLATDRGDLVLTLYDGLQVRHLASSTRVGMARFKTLDVRLALAPDVEVAGPASKSESELTFDDLWRRICGAEGRQAQAKAASILNARLARGAAFVFLPFLALALGSSWRRERAVHEGLLAAVVLFVVYDHMMNFIDAAVARSESFPGIVIWLVPAMFTLLSVWLFWSATFHFGRDPLSLTIEKITVMRMRSKTTSQ